MDVWNRLNENFSYAWAYLWSGRVFAIALGVLFAFVAVILFAASRTKWGQSKPLTKCIILAVLAHVWMLIYALSTHIMLPQSDPNGFRDERLTALNATLLEPMIPENATLGDNAVPQQPWEAPVDLAPAELLPGLGDSLLSDLVQTPTELPSLDPEPTPIPEMPPAIEPIEPKTLVDLIPDPSPTIDASPVAEPQPLLQPPPMPSANASPQLAGASQLNIPPLTASETKTDQSLQPPIIEVPPEYAMRLSGNRLELARPFGADEDTEAAVAAALKWLATAQSESGGWNAKQYGAGTETYALGEDRRGTGEKADTGVTGLALLAFLSAGHTHLEGEHRDVVRRGIEFLIRSQMPSGDLSGPLQIGKDQVVVNARMYCHGIAMLALAEAYALTHDVEIRKSLDKAVGYTLKAQDKIGGGWRYMPGNAGDLSQFGWQAMGLRSAQKSGIPIDRDTWGRMKSFVDSCSAGSAGGLARYRPNQGQPSPTMTAESFACRLLLDHPMTRAAAMEARQNMLAHLPGAEEDNVYYWYYATLALFQLQDESWQTWNMALKRRLLETQVPITQTDAGSWQPDRMWGGYGGRIYQTSMSCMCLEVYYRYLPLYQPAGSLRSGMQQPGIASRPGPIGR
ncbi:MAG: hypothetical protein U0892_00735 [Pirellulales bacterium]